MAVVIAGVSSGNSAEVDSDKNLRAVLKPPAFGALGCYSKSLVTSNMVATGSAGAVIWSCRWTDATRFAIIERIRVAGLVTGAITTAVPYYLSAFFNRNASVDYTTGIGTTGALGSNNAKRRTSHGTSLMGSILILGTLAVGMTGATGSLDTDALGTAMGDAGGVAGANIFGGTISLWDEAVNEHPLILAQNEGIVIRAPLAGPATGTIQLSVQCDWSEVAAY